MTRIKIIDAEAKLWENIIKKFEQLRKVDQISFYLDEGSGHYYNPNTKHLGVNYDYPKIAQLLKNILIKKKGAKVALISLGCGDCEKDKKILEHLQEAGHHFSFFGIDSSMAMLEKANTVLGDAAFETQLICANFGAVTFKKNLNKELKDYDLKIFLFLGNTFGNLNQEYIGDVLKRILNIGDYLLLDVAGVTTMTDTIEAELFDRYLEYLYDPAERQFFLQPLKSMGVPETCGKLSLKTAIDVNVQAIVFKFGFKIDTLTTVDLEVDDVITLGSTGYISLVNILVYDLQKLTKFLEERNFILQEELLGDHFNQLLFQKQ